MEIGGLTDIETAAERTRLTYREVEVLCLIGEGFSSQEVAEQLYLSKRTVDFHLSNVYEKLVVRNRVQAFRLASRLGLLKARARR